MCGKEKGCIPFSYALLSCANSSPKVLSYFWLDIPQYSVSTETLQTQSFTHSPLPLPLSLHRGGLEAQKAKITDSDKDNLLETANEIRK